MEEKQSIRKLTIEELKGVMVRFSEKPFRAKQLFEWLWQKDAASFEEMSSLPKALREQLERHYYIDHIELKDQQVSSDKTIKCAFNTQQGNIIEGVLIPTSKRMTACISSQIGCSLACKFCATGKLKLMRNLSAGEMVDQVTYLRDQAQLKYGSTLSNIVYMGMGEPLLNYNNMIQSTNLITSEQGLGISPKRITVSTAGIAKMIKRLGDDEVKFNLALSLHAANDKKRSHIMEINDSNNLDALREALKYFHEKTDTSVTFESQIFKDFKGDKHLELIIYESSEKIKITMPSKKFKIDISNDLLKRLEKEQISYKLN